MGIQANIGAWLMHHNERGTIGGFKHKMNFLALAECTRLEDFCPQAMGQVGYTSPPSSTPLPRTSKQHTVLGQYCNQRQWQDPSLPVSVQSIYQPD